MLVQTPKRATDQWVALFIDTDFYRHALADASYPRTKAILDFLIQTFPDQISLLSCEELTSTLYYIQSNYYRFF